MGTPVFRRRRPLPPSSPIPSDFKVANVEFAPMAPGGGHRLLAAITRNIDLEGGGEGRYDAHVSEGNMLRVLSERLFCVCTSARWSCNGMHALLAAGDEFEGVWVGGWGWGSGVVAHR